MLSNDIAIRVNNVSKVYYSFNEPKDRLLQMFDKKKRHKAYWALKSVSFDIKKGSTVGVVGKNGAGKSTLLQMIAGTVMPTEGSIETNGRIVALLELGSGFNPEFTGRENVFLNGSMFGISRKEMELKFPIITSFADIGSFIDQPVKTYSSGMFARLAFAVAINMDPDILIVDEILSVGDIAFQAKCTSMLRRMKDKGLTIFFVSHSVDAIKSLCSEAILLHKGELLKIGTSEEITNIYLASMREEMNSYQEGYSSDQVVEYNDVHIDESNKGFRYGSGEVNFTKVEMVNHPGQPTKSFNFEDVATLRCTIKSKIAVNGVNVSFLVRDNTGIDLFGTTMFDERLPLIDLKAGESATVEFVFPIKIRQGSYSVCVAVNTVTQRDYSDVYLFEQVDSAAAFEVIRNTERPVHYKFFVPTTINPVIKE